MKLGACLRQDLVANRKGSTGGLLVNILNLRFLATVMFRLSSTAGSRSPLFGYAVKQMNQLLTGADIAWQAQISGGLVLRHPVGVVIGKDVIAGSSLVIQQGVTLGGDGTADQGVEYFPELGDRVQVGAGARVLGGIRLGDDVIVGANAVVLTDVPNGGFVAGVPARLVRVRQPETSV